VGGAPDHPWFSHNGANEGFRSDLIAYDSGDGFVIMTNSDNGGGLMEEVARTVAAEYRWPDFGPRTPTRLVSPPKDIDRYVGAYEITRFVAMMVSRQGDALVLQQQQGAPPEQFLPGADGTWFSTQSGRQVTFDRGPDGQVIDLSFAEGPVPGKMKRLPDGAVETRAAELVARVKAQVPDNRTEGVIRELIDSVRDGRVNYDHFGERMAIAARAQFPDMLSDFKSLGDLKALAFKGVGPGGGDIYEATFANGKREFRVLLDPQGRIDAMGIQLG
jgi:hypothetical protein